LYYDSSANYLYIASSLSNVVVKWQPFASSGTIVAGMQSHPRCFSRKKVNFSSKLFFVILGVLNTPGLGSSLLYSPGSVIYDSTTQQLYVCDSGNSRIMGYCSGNLAGVVLAGTGVPGLSSTQLAYPTDFGFDTNRNLYVVDNSNTRIQKYARL
jgi:DNA-binding beta-propeller fold protein YncE